MKVEDPNALRFILQDEIYLLSEDKPVFSAAATILAIETQQVVFNYLGGNKKNLLVLVHYDQFEFMQDEHLEALESVLLRKGHTRHDVAIVNLAKQDANFGQLSSFFEPKTLIILGKEALPEGLESPKFNQIENRARIPVLFTFSFGEMMANTDNKRTFWDQVKNI